MHHSGDQHVGHLRVQTTRISVMQGNYYESETRDNNDGKITLKLIIENISLYINLDCGK